MHNRRIGKTVDTDGDGDVDSRERYVWDVAAMDGKGNVVLDFVDDDLDGTAEGDELDKRYLWGQAVDQVFAQENVDLLSAGAEDVDWLLTDNLGTVRDVVTYDDANDTTTVDEHLTYAAFGKITSGDDTATRYTYTAQEIDTHTGLYYYDQRWYDSATGKFMSQDPIEDDKTNGDRYVGNNPTNKIDPSGLDDIRVVERDGAKIVQWMPEGWFGRDLPDGAVDLGILDDDGETVHFHPVYQLGSMKLSEAQDYGGRNSIESVLIGLAESQGQEFYWHRMINSIITTKYEDAGDLLRKHGQTILVTRSWEWFFDTPVVETHEGVQLDVELTLSGAADAYYKYLQAKEAKRVAAFREKNASGLLKDVDVMKQIAGQTGVQMALTKQQFSRSAMVMLEELQWHLYVEAPISAASAFLTVGSFKFPGGLDDVASAATNAGKRSVGGSSKALSGLHNTRNFIPGRLQGRPDTCGLYCARSMMNDLGTAPSKLKISSDLRRTIMRQGGLDEEQLVRFIHDQSENAWAVPKRNVTNTELMRSLTRGKVMAHVDGNHWVQVQTVYSQNGRVWARVADSGRGGQYDQLLDSLMTRMGSDSAIVLTGKH